MKAYYESKLAEGKNKMSVLNAIRNKIILRIFSCVKNKKLYKNHVYPLAKPKKSMQEKPYSSSVASRLIFHQNSINSQALIYASCFCA